MESIFKIKRLHIYIFLLLSIAGLYSHQSRCELNFSSRQCNNLKKKHLLISNVFLSSSNEIFFRSKSTKAHLLPLSSHFHGSHFLRRGWIPPFSSCRASFALNPASPPFGLPDFSFASFIHDTIT